MLECLAGNRCIDCAVVNTCGNFILLNRCGNCVVGNTCKKYMELERCEDCVDVCGKCVVADMRKLCDDGHVLEVCGWEQVWGLCGSENVLKLFFYSYIGGWSRAT